MATIYRFGRFELSPATRRLLVDHHPAALGARAFDVLLALIERSDRLVTKSELLDLVWPGLVVEENNLQVQISTLRKLLGREAIATVPGRGYRFTLALAPTDSDAPEVHPATAQSNFSRSIYDVPEQEPLLLGRENDLATLGHLLKQHALVTVVGPGGIGKTRVAEALADQWRRQFGGDACIAQLAPITDPKLVAPTIARAAGLELSLHRSPLEGLVELLHDRELLLVLDNCEHLISVVSEAAAAINGGARKVRILATAQEPLKVSDEAVHWLGPLALPSAGQEADALNFSAVQLFVTRTQDAVGRFEPSVPEVEAIVEICRRLDGIALAIELAAARVPLLGVEGVRQRLDERFRLLTGGSRAALPKHRTLRASFEWSYRLLSDRDRAVFDRLAVFPASFSMAAAHQVAAHGQIDEWGVLDHLGTLVDKSFVSVEGGDKPRYRLPETARAYSLERLAARGDTDNVMGRFADAMIDVLKSADEETDNGAPQLIVYGALLPDLDNLRAAITWAAQSKDTIEVAAELAGRATGLWDVANSNAEGFAWCDSVAQNVGEFVSAPVAARFWEAYSYIGRDVARRPQLIAAANKAVQYHRETGDRIALHSGLWVLALHLASSAHAEAATPVIQEIEDIRKTMQPSWQRLSHETLLGFWHANSGRVEEARAHFAVTLDLCQRENRAIGFANALLNLAWIEFLAGNAEAAARLASQRLDSGPAVLDKTKASAFAWLGTALAELGRLPEARAALVHALRLFMRLYATPVLMLDRVAYAIALEGHGSCAAKIIGLVDREVGADRSVAAKAVVERALDAVRKSCSMEEIAKLRLAGAQMTTEEAITLAGLPSLQRKHEVLG